MLISVGEDRVKAMRTTEVEPLWVSLIVNDAFFMIITVVVQYYSFIFMVITVPSSSLLSF